MDQLLLRGCLLKNCDYVYGAVIYTGHETKIMLNSVEAPSKTSNVMRTMNNMLYTVFGFQAFICLLFAGIGFYWDYQNSEDHSYLAYNKGLDAWLYITKALTYMVAYSHLIPISLYVAMEVVKLCLAFLIGQDLQMYYEPNDVPAVCRVSDLIEELG